MTGPQSTGSPGPRAMSGEDTSSAVGSSGDTSAVPSQTSRDRGVGDAELPGGLAAAELAGLDCGTKGFEIPVELPRAAEDGTLLLGPAHTGLDPFAQDPALELTPRGAAISPRRPRRPRRRSAR